MLVEKMNLAFSSLSVALLISLIAGIASGANQYLKERRNEPPTFDWIDFVLVSFTSVFVGLMGYFGSALFIDEAEGRLLITGLSAAAGWGGLIAVKEMLLDLLRKRLTGKDSDGLQKLLEIEKELATLKSTLKEKRESNVDAK